MIDGSDSGLYPSKVERLKRFSRIVRTTNVRSKDSEHVFIPVETSRWGYCCSVFRDFLLDP